MYKVQEQKAVIVDKSPFLHGGVSKAPSFQICRALMVTPCLLVDTLQLTAAGMWHQAALQGRIVHAKLFQGTALAAVQQPVLSGVILRPWRDLGQSIQDAVKKTFSF